LRTPRQPAVAVCRRLARLRIGRADDLAGNIWLDGEVVSNAKVIMKVALDVCDRAA
jgi:hypothetical protein